MAVVMIDLDKFKTINDTLGHHAGDAVLVEVASRMHKNMRESDMVSRFGGDEFAMILAFGKSEWQAITKVLRRNMLALKKPIKVENQEVFVTASFGVSVYPEDGDSPKVLMMCADEAMYHAKALGRNACVFWKKAKRYTVVRFDAD
jgi:diguanylate cyclase (GGDEF)-like protein